MIKQKLNKINQVGNRNGWIALRVNRAINIGAINRRRYCLTAVKQKLNKVNQVSNCYGMG
jgi:hypothetical protein